MECPICDLCDIPLKRVVATNGEVWLHCTQCGTAEKTKDLAPNPTDRLEDYNEKEKTDLS